MEKILTIAVFLLTIILVILLALMVFLAIYYLRNTKKKSEDTHKSSKNPRQGYCMNHPDEMAQGTCAICELPFCEKCLWENEKIHFCPEHYQTFMNNKWLELAKIHSTPDTPESALALYDLKAIVWKEKIPTFIVTHYKINFEGDQIESYVSLMGRQQDAEDLSQRLEVLKKEKPS